MADRQIVIDILANDYATQVFRNVGHGVSSFASTAFNGIESANRALRRYNSSMQGFNSIVTGAMRTAGKAVYNFTTDSIRQFAELESQHAKTMGVLSSSYDFNFAGPNTAEQLKNMEQFYKDSAALKEQAYVMGSVGPTGNGSLFNPTEISQAQTSLARAGITPEQMLNSDVVETVIKFAGGNDISIDDAVAFGVQLGAQFDKDPSEWGQMFDMVTYAANSAPIDVNDVMASLKYVGNMASGYDVPLSDVLAAVAIMGNSGLKGSQAGSGISAIFSRGMNPTGITTASKAPTENVENVYNNFKDKVIDENGSFIGLEGFTEELQTIMDGLTDVELAWFNKKMFGMYQQKAALALGRTSEDADKTFGYLADAIVNNSEGLNDAIYNLMVESSGGQLEALQNAWDATKMRFGDALSPLTKELTKQLINGLTTKNFKFDNQGLQTALDQAVENVDNQFGEYIGGWVEQIGQLGIDAIQIAPAEMPVITGYIEALGKVASGDFVGAWQAFQDGLDETNERISELPPELQGTAEGLRDMIVMFEGLFALNIVTKISELLSSLALIIGTFGGGIFKLFRGNTNVSANSTVMSTNTVVNANYAGVNAGQVGNATFGMIQNVASFIATTTSMTVTATSVIVNGGSVTGGTPGTGGGPTLVDANGNPLSSFTNGMAQGAGFSLGAGGTAVGGGMLLNGMLRNGMLGAGGASAALPAAGGAAGALPAASGAAGAAGGAALSGTSASTLGALGILAKLGVATVGSYAMISTLGSPGLLQSADSRARDGSGNIDAFVARLGEANISVSEYVAELDRLRERHENGTLSTRDYNAAIDRYNNSIFGKGNAHGTPNDAYVLYYAQGHEDYEDNGGDLNTYDLWYREVMGREAARDEMIRAYTSQEGAQLLIDAISEQLMQGKSLTEEWLTSALTYTKDGYQYTGSNDDMIAIMREIFGSSTFDSTYKPSWTYSGRFNDSAITSYWLNHGVGVNADVDLSHLSSLDAAMGQTADTMTQAANDIANSTSGAVVDINAARSMATALVTNGGVNILELGQGPLSAEGAIDYLTNQMTGNAGSKKDMFNIPSPFSMLSGNNIMNRFTSSMAGNTESGTGMTDTNALLSDIDADVSTIAANAANNITDEGLRAAFIEGFGGYESGLTTNVAGLSNSVITLQDAVSTLSKSPAWVNQLGQGPLSADGAYSYVMGQLASGTAANQQLLQNIQSGISALDPSLTVDITNRQPIVNTTVNVKVDRAGNVTKQVLQGFGGFDKYLFKSSQRYGTTTRIER